VTDLTDSQRYESAILTMAGRNYTIPDLGGNSSSTGTGTYDLGTISLSGSFTLKARHTHANTNTGLWYSDQTSRFTGNPESINLSSVFLDDITPAPTCRMSADPASINAGQSSTLSWSSTNTTSASINQGIGSVAVNGSRAVSPSATTTYTGTFTGPGGTVTCTALVTVGTTPPPPPPSEEEDEDCDGSIGNYVWNDANGDGVQDSNEKGIQGIRVKLTNLDNDDESRYTTSKNGHYEFKDLCEGEYKVTVKDEDVASLTQTYDPDGKKNNKTEVELEGDNDNHTKADFGYRGKPIAPRTGSGNMAIYLSALVSLLSIATYLKIKRAKAYMQK